MFPTVYVIYTVEVIPWSTGFILWTHSLYTVGKTVYTVGDMYCSPQYIQIWFPTVYPPQYIQIWFPTVYIFILWRTNYMLWGTNIIYCGDQNIYRGAHKLRSPQYIPHSIYFKLPTVYIMLHTVYKGQATIYRGEIDIYTVGTRYILWVHPYILCECRVGNMSYILWGNG